MRSNEVVQAEEALRDAIADVKNDGSQVGPKRELTNYVTEIKFPNQFDERWHTAIVENLNEWHDAADDGTPHYEVTTNWTFPTGDIRTNLTGEPTPTDETGEYYDRLCQCGKGNQIESMVEKMEQWGRNNRTCAQVFQVDTDLNAMFPPCLMNLQALYRDGEVNLTAYFRSHTLAKSYYGDIRALERLQHYLSERVGAGVGSLVVHSGSIHIRKENDEHKLADKLCEVLRQ